MEPFHVPSLPGQVSWPARPDSYQLDPDGSLVIAAGAHTNLFSSPQGDRVEANAPRAMFDPGEGDFMLSAKLHVPFASTFDAGALIIWQDDDWWGKLCFEYSPQGEPMIVSVVTHAGMSDDCNSVVIRGNEIWLRVARVGRAFGFHYSHDGSYWHMVRHFTLSRPQDVTAGLCSQSPRGAGCQTTFSEISFARGTLANLRDGS